uniref:Uncharacterized protein n=1 Tax=Micrurus lemniscatus lemniscatus TaxID=129467 RepID=A0A2D4HWK9_MICLE
MVNPRFLFFLEYFPPYLLAKPIYLHSDFCGFSPHIKLFCSVFRIIWLTNAWNLKFLCILSALSLVLMIDTRWHTNQRQKRMQMYIFPLPVQLLKTPCVCVCVFCVYERKRVYVCMWNDISSHQVFYIRSATVETEEGKSKINFITEFSTFYSK